jgi:hypothetical protein
MLARPSTQLVTWTIAVVVWMALLPSASHASPPWYTETIQGGGFVGDFIRLAVDDDGVPHVVYMDYNNFFVMYATRVDGAWTTEVIAAEVFLGTDLDIAVDAQRVPHVSYHAYTGSGIDELRYADRTGGSWTVVDVDPTNNDVGKYNSIAIDSQGRPHIAYYDETLADLKYAVKTGGWSIEIADGTWGLYADMALDSSDRPHIAYFSTAPAELLYTTKIGSFWYEETISAESADYKGIALDPAGNPVITSNSGGYLNVYTRDSGTFVNIYGDNPTDSDGAIAIGTDGTVHIFYQNIDAGANDLWYLELRDSVWSASPAALGGSVVDLGDKCDIALDPYGNPLGVYYDATNGDAMFIDSGVRLSTPLSGVTWPVGGERSVSWSGSGAINLYLSTDGGATYDALALGLTGGGSPGGGAYNFTVPHQPSRFCKVKIVRTSPYAASLSDSLFTIEASVALLNFVVTLADAGGAALTWSTNPGPDDLAGYRVDRRRDSGAWSTRVALTDKTSYHDADGRGGDEYRLFAVNGLGEELLLGTGSPGRAPSITALDVFPNPFGAGELTVDFATAGGLGGGAGRASVAVYDVAGRLVRTLVDRAYPAGVQRVAWDGRSANGDAVSSGVYFVRSVSGADTHTKKVLVVR